ncbi:unnamed protein product [Dracunculus medinensis]|uniref:Glyco_hydro_35 domain-containing protein n=1 Tax=Dracunculus medinensis TaxID=318479 RepID=A0A0N4U468_DRAME|nr:unnamed protein product [Dracunculus medinensis]
MLIRGYKIIDIKISKQFVADQPFELGPYNCGEWENGGLPWWLILDKDIEMRTYDKRYITAVKMWFDVLLPKLVPYLRKNGGPVLMVQLENEYGSYYACDQNYTSWLSALIQSHFGKDIVQYTTDGPGDSYLKCGTIPGVYPTIDFGPSKIEEIDSYFAAQRRFANKGPLVNSEFYPGWIVLWGQTKQVIPPIMEFMESAIYMYKLGASFNYYMFAGGTNFGFWNGAEVAAPVITSYDFTAPISEAGDITPKYIAIRDWLETVSDWPNRPTDIPENNPKIGYGEVNLRRLTEISDHRAIAQFSRCIKSTYPKSFEDIHHPLGFVLYSTKLKIVGSNLTIPLIKDHGFTFLDGKLQEVFVNILGNYSKNWMIIKNAMIGSNLVILVENRGRQTYETINDFKGILSNVTLDGHILDDWVQCGITLKAIYRQLRRPGRNIFYRQLNRAKTIKNNEKNNPGVYVGTFKANPVVDTFFDPTGWGKGQVMINGFNIGRYWPSLGPQVTLYIPAPILRRNNIIILLELEYAGNCITNQCKINFIDHPVFNFTDNPYHVEQYMKKTIGNA